MATSLTIVRQNGNVPKSQNGQDHVSGFVAYLLEADIPAAFKAEPVQAVSTIDKAEELGITADATAWSVKMLHYQLEEVFRINPSITLYVGLFSKPESMTFQELKRCRTMRREPSDKWPSGTATLHRQLTIS